MVNLETYEIAGLGFYTLCHDPKDYGKITVLGDKDTLYEYRNLAIEVFEEPTGFNARIVYTDQDRYVTRGEWKYAHTIFRAIGMVMLYEMEIELGHK